MVPFVSQIRSPIGVGWIVVIYLVTLAPYYMVLGRFCCGHGCRYFDSLQIANCSLCGNDIYFRDGDRLSLPCKPCDNTSASGGVRWTLYRSTDEAYPMDRRGNSLNITFHRNLSGTYYCRDANNGGAQASINLRYCAGTFPKPDITCTFSIPSTVSISCRWKLRSRLDDHCTMYKRAYLTSKTSPPIGRETKLELVNNSCFTDCQSQTYLGDVSADFYTYSILGDISDNVTLTIFAENRLNGTARFNYQIHLLSHYKPLNGLEVLYFDGTLMEIRARLHPYLSDQNYCRYEFSVAAAAGKHIRSTNGYYCLRTREGSYVHKVLNVPRYRKGQNVVISYRLLGSRHWSDPLKVSAAKITGSMSHNAVLAWIRPLYYTNGSTLNVVIPTVRWLHRYHPSWTLSFAWYYQNGKDRVIHGNHISSKLPDFTGPLTIKVHLRSYKQPLITIPILVSANSMDMHLPNMFTVFDQEVSNRTLIRWSRMDPKPGHYIRTIACAGKSWLGCETIAEQPSNGKSYATYPLPYKLFALSVCSIMTQECSRMMFPKMFLIGELQAPTISTTLTNVASNPVVIFNGTEVAEVNGMFENYSLVLREIHYPCKNSWNGFRCQVECRVSVPTMGIISLDIHAVAPLLSLSPIIRTSRIQLPCPGATPLSSVENPLASQASTPVMTFIVSSLVIIILVIIALLYIKHRHMNPGAGTLSCYSVKSAIRRDTQEDSYAAYEEYAPNVYMDRLPRTPPPGLNSLLRAPTSRLTRGEATHPATLVCDKAYFTDVYNPASEEENYADLSTDEGYQDSSYTATSPIPETAEGTPKPEFGATSNDLLLQSLLDNVTNGHCTTDAEYETQEEDSGDDSSNLSFPDEAVSNQAVSSSGYSGRMEIRSFDCYN